MSRASGRRGLLLVALFLVLLVVLADLMRSDSFLRGQLGQTNQPTMPLERAVKDFRRERRSNVLPRSNRVEWGGTRPFMPQAHSPA